MKKKEKSPFAKELENARKIQEDKQLPFEERQENRYKKVDYIFDELASKENRYIFYCPDIPFGCSLVKIIYEYAKITQELGYKTIVLHEVKGFIPKWFDFDWAKDIKKDYVSSKEGGAAEYKFAPSDTIIIPDGFFTIMKGFYQINPLHKVVLAIGYNGLASMEPGYTWEAIGFKDVICISEDIKNNYQSLFPNLNYYVSSYVVDFDKLTPLESKKIKPTIGLMIRDRELASKIVNIFTNKYKYFNYFQFKVLKKLSISQYCDELSKCAVVIFADDKSAIPAPLVEALATQVPVITHKNSFLNSFQGVDTFYVTETMDEFEITDCLANFCDLWSSNPSSVFKHSNIEIEKVLNNFKEENVKLSLIEILNNLQEEKIKTFTAIEKLIDEGKIDKNN